MSDSRFLESIELERDMVHEQWGWYTFQKSDEKTMKTAYI